jgi:hypothetical protein
MAVGKNFRQGIYTPINRDKYKGVKDPTYRSSWELHLFKFLDNNKNVVEWYSELPIPYYSSVKGRMARYFVDIYVVYLNKNGDRVVEIIEVKPSSELTPPTKGKTQKAEARYLQESLTYITNQEKWAAAAEYANERGWLFRILTEKHIFRG